MTRYLLAAEADQIQDLVFRAARLRAVVGGSQVLSNFCKAAPQGLGVPDGDVIVADGGSFRIRFNDEATALEFGRELADFYRIRADGVLTVGDPVAYDEQGFQTANDAATTSLRRAKHNGDPPAMPVQLPIVALCASCGIGMAAKHKRAFEDSRPSYLCDSCANKAGFEKEDLEILENFKSEVCTLANRAPGDVPHLPFEAENVGDLDPRRYVAYLVADGNGMGSWFGRCRNEAQLSALSHGLKRVMRESLAAPCPSLLDRVEEIRRPPNHNGTAGAMLDAAHVGRVAGSTHRDYEDLLPVLPLILAGDDCFALIAAPWSIDYTRIFCERFEFGMADLVAKLGLCDGGSTPTVSAAVVVCKVNYPYRLARRRADARLGEAKRLAKASVPYRSVVSFEVVTGNSLPSSFDEQEGDVRASLDPYLLADVQTLLDLRVELERVGNKRRAQLRAYFDEPPLNRATLAEWNQRLQNELLRRIDRDDLAGAAVRRALEVLGGGQFDPNVGYWRKIFRHGQLIFAHGLPDLLQAWRYMHRLETRFGEYDAEEA